MVFGCSFCVPSPPQAIEVKTVPRTEQRLKARQSGKTPSAAVNVAECDERKKHELSLELSPQSVAQCPKVYMPPQYAYESKVSRLLFMPPDGKVSFGQVSRQGKLKMRMVEDGFDRWVQAWRLEIAALKQERNCRVQHAVRLTEQERLRRVRQATKYGQLKSTGKIFDVTFTSHLNLKLGTSTLKSRGAMVMEPIKRIGRSGGYVPMVGWGDELIAINSQWVSNWSCSMISARLARMTQRPLTLTFGTKEGLIAMSANQEVDHLLRSLGNLEQQMASMQTEYERKLDVSMQEQKRWQQMQKDEKDHERQRRLLQLRQQREQQRNLQQLHERTEIKVKHVRDLFQQRLKKPKTEVEEPEAQGDSCRNGSCQNDDDDEYFHLGMSYCISVLAPCGEFCFRFRSPG
jgi:hypothetical protein